MKVSNETLLTPIYLKLSAEMPWPEAEKVFYLLAGDGLFLCRNHPFFRSSVRAPKAPAELAAHDPFLKLSYPKLPQRLLEKVVGFFARIGLRYGAEAAVLLAWNRTAQRVEVIVPEQHSIVSVGWQGRCHPIEVRYAVPPLPSHVLIIGDIHCHVHGPAYASVMDKNDELHRPGLHIVVGRIGEEPPEFHIEATVDGTRFAVKDPSLVLAGYERRRLHEVPQDWLGKVTVKSWNDYAASSSGPWSSSVVIEQAGQGNVAQGNEEVSRPPLPPNGSRSSQDSFTGGRASSDPGPDSNEEDSR